MVLESCREPRKFSCMDPCGAGLRSDWETFRAVALVGALLEMVLRSFLAIPGFASLVWPQFSPYPPEIVRAVLHNKSSAGHTAKVRFGGTASTGF